MERFRRHWLALAGGLLVVGMSASAVFGADPTETDADVPMGLQVSAFVHGLVFGQSDENADEDTDTDESTDEDSTEDQSEDTDTENTDTEDTDTEDTDETSDESTDVTGQEHGQCVAAVAQGEDVGGPNENHGGAVSEAARVTCWEPPDAEEAPVEDTSTEDASTDEQAQLSDKDQMKADRAAARDERKAGHDAWKEARKSGFATTSWNQDGGSHRHSGGHGKGGRH